MDPSGQAACLDTASGRKRGKGNALEAATNSHLFAQTAAEHTTADHRPKEFLPRFGGKFNCPDAPDLQGTRLAALSLERSILSSATEERVEVQKEH